MTGGRLALALLAGLAGIASPVSAQGVMARPGLPLSMGQEVGVPRAPLLTIDRERLYTESAYGQRVQSDLQQAARDLASENRAIETELAAREQELTDLRATLPFEEFRALADTFDARVTRLRSEQDAKARALSRRRDLERQSFFAGALPVLSQIVREAGALAILDKTAVFISAEEVDVTDLAITRLDEALGDGALGDGALEDGALGDGAQRDPATEGAVSDPNSALDASPSDDPAD